MHGLEPDMDKAGEFLEELPKNSRAAEKPLEEILSEAKEVQEQIQQKVVEAEKLFNDTKGVLKNAK